MNIRNIFSGHGRSRNDYSEASFQRVIEEVQTVRSEMGAEKTSLVRTLKPLKTGTDKTVITLSPMRSLSFEDFTYPFSSTAKIRDALKLQVMPYSAAGELEIFPVILEKSGRTSSGIVWYVSPDELDIPSSHSQKIWPSPLPFVSGLKEYGGNGATIWVDEENISSILWQSNRPVLYRWKKLSGHDAEEEITSWYDRYCEARGLIRGGNFVVKASGNTEAGEEFSDVISESVEICPWIAEVNLSRRVLEGARDLERTVRTLAKVSGGLVIAGAVMLGAEILEYYHTSLEVTEARERSEKFYRETFDPERTGRISNPVTLARDKIASFTGKGEDGRQIDEVLADMGEVCSDFSDSSMTIDTIRYNADGLDCTGTAPDMTTVLNFRRSWEEKANLVQVDNTQFVSGIGYRFDIRIRW